MIAEMAQVLILGRKRDSLDVMRVLQDAGVVHIDPLEAAELPKGTLQGAEAERRAALERLIARTESAIAAVGAGKTQPDMNRLQGLDLEGFLEDIGHRADVLSREQADLDAEIQAINTFGDAARILGDLTGSLARSDRVATLGFTVADAEELAKLEKTLKDAGLTYAIGHEPSGKVSVGVLAVRKQDASLARTALSRAGLGELRLPGKFDGMNFADAAARMSQRARTAPEELQGVRDGLERLRREHGATLAAARLELRDELARYQTVESGVAGKYGFAVRGWVPVDNKAGLESALAAMKGQVIYQFESAPTHHASHVPVKLKNHPVFRPFEILLGLFAPPAYGSFDPTWVLAVCFPLFFGFVIGDIGLGLVSLAVAFWLRGMGNDGKTLDLGPLGIRVPPKSLLNVSTVLTWMAAWSIVFGFAYGELFGTLGENLGLFHVVKKEVTLADGTKTKQAVAGFFNAPDKRKEGQAYEFNWPTDGSFPSALLAREYHEERHHGIPILLPRVKSDFSGVMLILALIPGVFQVLYGWFIRFRSGMVHHDRKHMYEGLGMFLGLIGVILIAYAYRNPGSSPVFYYVGGALLLAFLACIVLSGVQMMIIEIISNGGNILSYLRLYAVGLSSAILANLATDTGWNLGASIGVIGILLGVLVAALIHLFAIVFTIIGHVLQPLRLHYAEFFTKFGFYEESGRPYRPFSRAARDVASART